MASGDYQHTQFGTVIVAALGAVTAWFLWIAVFVLDEGAARGVFAAVTLLLIVLLAMFRSLTVRVDAQDVSLWFGWGWPRHRISLSAIERVNTAHRTWLWGYGIRFTMTGWMWRVSGLQTVEIRRTGERSFFVGTNEPDALAAAIAARLPERQRTRGDQIRGTSGSG